MAGAALILATTGLCSTAAGQRLAVPVTLGSSESLRILWVKADARPGGVEVSGRVRRQPFVVGPVRGHLHIEAVFGDGRPPAVADAHWMTLPARGSATAAFGTLLKTGGSDHIKLIRVEHRLHDDDQ
jgi:hypothetical protein